jgi:O-antigen ligase
MAVALSPLWSGYYNFGLWAPLALGAILVLVVVALAARPTFTRVGLTASGALAVLLALSAASMLWAESKESAWTSSNQLALYVVIFAIGVLAIRERRSARTIALVLGAPALLTAVVVTVELIAGGGGLFFQGRLDSPMGYINGTAGLLVMGIWPWIALAETGPSRLVRAAAMSGASLIASTAVLTQSRSIVPATVVATSLVLASSPGRARRALHLVIVGCAVALGLHWTLAVYRASGPVQALPLHSGVLRPAGLAILGGALLGAAAKLALSALAGRIPRELRTVSERRVGVALSIGALVAVIAIAITGSSTISRQYDNFTQNKVDQAAPNRVLTGGSFRYDMWRIAADEFRAHPLGGVGAGNYDVDYYRLRQNPQSVTVPHSVEMQFAAELGIGGLLALLVFCGAILLGGFARRRTLASVDPLVRISALGVFAAWLTATSVDWLYNFPGLAGAAMLAAALVVVPVPIRERSAEPPAGRSRTTRAVLVIGIAALGLAAASIGRQYAASRYAASAASAVRTHPTAAIATLRTAEQLDPNALTTLYAIASAYAQLDDYRDARAALLDAERREPHNYVPPALLGDLATRRGYPRIAEAAYARALRLDPREPVLQAALAAARKATG